MLDTVSIISLKGLRPRCRLPWRQRSRSFGPNDENEVTRLDVGQRKLQETTENPDGEDSTLTSFSPRTEGFGVGEVQRESNRVRSFEGHSVLFRIWEYLFWGHPRGPLNLDGGKSSGFEYWFTQEVSWMTHDPGRVSDPGPISYSSYPSLFLDSSTPNLLSSLELQTIVLTVLRVIQSFITYFNYVKWLSSWWFYIYIYRVNHLPFFVVRSFLGVPIRLRSRSKTGSHRRLENHQRQKQNYQTPKSSIICFGSGTFIHMSIRVFEVLSVLEVFRYWSHLLKKIFVLLTPSPHLYD